MRKIREVLRLRYEHGFSQHAMSRSVLIGQATVGEYLHRAEAAGLVWPLPLEFSNEDLERLLFPPKPSADEKPRPMPDWSLVDQELSKKGVTVLLLWQEYRQQHPGGYGYSRYSDLYREWKGKTDLRMCQRHKAGEKLFADFVGLQMELTNPSTGKTRSVPIFTCAMGASQRIFARPMNLKRPVTGFVALTTVSDFTGTSRGGGAGQPESMCHESGSI